MGIQPFPIISNLPPLIIHLGITIAYQLATHHGVLLFYLFLLSFLFFLAYIHVTRIITAMINVHVPDTVIIMTAGLLLSSLAAVLGDMLSISKNHSNDNKINS